MKKFFVIIGIAFAMFISGVIGYNYANAQIKEDIDNEPSYNDIVEAYVDHVYGEDYDKIVIGDTTIADHSELTDLWIYNDGELVDLISVNMEYCANMVA